MVGGGTSRPQARRHHPHMSLRPLVSVVIPTRDRRGHLERALRSSLAQRGVDVRVIVVDEASEDDTLAWLAGVDDPRLHVVRHARSKGVATARNAGLEIVETPWVAFLDDDDLWAPDKLASQIDAAVRAGVAWSCVGACVIDEAQEARYFQRPPRPEDCVDRLLLSNVVPGGGSGVVVRTETIRRIGGFDPNLGTLADWDMWIRLAIDGPPASVNRMLLAYMVHEKTMSRLAENVEAELEAISGRYADECGRRGLGPAVDMLLWIAKMHWRAGRHRRSIETLRRTRSITLSARFVARKFLWDTMPRRLQLAWARRAAGVTRAEVREVRAWIELQADVVPGNQGGTSRAPSLESADRDDTARSEHAAGSTGAAHAEGEVPH